MVEGLLLACVGLAMCLLFPTNLPVVLVGQFIKVSGTIPSSYLASVLLSEALDDVQEKSGARCDGFTSSLYNSILTLTSGIAVSILNGGMAVLGYAAPSAGEAVAQPQPVQLFFYLLSNGGGSSGVSHFSGNAFLFWKSKKETFERDISQCGYYQLKF